MSTYTHDKKGKRGNARHQFLFIFYFHEFGGHSVAEFPTIFKVLCFMWKIIAFCPITHQFLFAYSTSTSWKTEEFPQKPSRAHPERRAMGHRDWRVPSCPSDSVTLMGFPSALWGKTLVSEACPITCISPRSCTIVLEFSRKHFQHIGA